MASGETLSTTRGRNKTRGTSRGRNQTRDWRESKQTLNQLCPTEIAYWTKIMSLSQPGPHI